MSIVENVRVYDLDECLIAAGYSMKAKAMTAEEIGKEKESFSYWSQYGSFLKDFYFYYQKCEKDSELYPRYELLEDGVKFLAKSQEGKINYTYINYIDLPMVFMAKSKCFSNERFRVNGDFFYRQIFPDITEDQVVDHINRDKHDNRRSNLRICTRQENERNKGLKPHNTSGVTGVSWEKRRNKWRAYISINGHQIYLGQYVDKEDAIYARLMGEKKYFGEFAPQKHLFNQYGIEDEPVEIDKTFKDYPIQAAMRLYKRMINLVHASEVDNNAHFQYATGIRVSFDLTFTIKAWTEAERYRFLEFVSSQSTLHRITKMDLDSVYNEYVDPVMIKRMKELVEDYNKEPSQEKKLHIVYSNPNGMKLTARMTTNYRCLRNIYKQRKNHQLPEWREFCEWIETLPYAHELITGDIIAEEKTNV